MHSVRFSTRTLSSGVVERDFTVGDIPGVLWSSPSATAPAPVVAPATAAAPAPASASVSATAAASAPAAAPAAPAAPAYGQAAGYRAPPTNTMAIVGMVLSLAGLLVGITAIVGAILGHVALGQIKRTGEGGRAFALTAVIAGWIITGFWLLIIIVYIIFFAIFFTSYGAYSSY